jgi:hypothetical protein
VEGDSIKLEGSDCPKSKLYDELFIYFLNNIILIRSLILEGEGT